MRVIVIVPGRGSVEARVLARDIERARSEGYEPWAEPANRAVRRITGHRTAWPWRWNLEGYRADGSMASYRATFVRTPRGYRPGSGYPVVAEAVATVYADGQPE